jgi:hypothetical protein
MNCEGMSQCNSYDMRWLVYCATLSKAIKTGPTLDKLEYYVPECYRRPKALPNEKASEESPPSTGARNIKMSKQPALPSVKSKEEACRYRYT